MRMSEIRTGVTYKTRQRKSDDRRSRQPFLVHQTGLYQVGYTQAKFVLGSFEDGDSEVLASADLTQTWAAYQAEITRITEEWEHLTDLRDRCKSLLTGHRTYVSTSSDCTLALLIEMEDLHELLRNTGQGALVDQINKDEHLDLRKWGVLATRGFSNLIGEQVQGSKSFLGLSRAITFRLDAEKAERLLVALGDTSSESDSALESIVNGLLS